MEQNVNQDLNTMDNITLDDIREIIDHPFTPAKKNTPNDTFEKGFVFTFSDGNIVGFDIYKRTHTHGEGHSFFLLKNGKDMQFASTFEVAKSYMYDYTNDYLQQQN